MNHLIARAELIISELQIDSPGSMQELDACLEAGRADRTVVVLPSLGGPVAPLDHLVADRFPRTIHADELETDPLATFVFADLVDRMVAIADLPLKQRVELTQTGGLDRQFPVPLAELAGGYEALARRWRSQGNSPAAALAWAKAAQSAGADARRLLVESAKEYFRSEQLDAVAAALSNAETVAGAGDGALDAQLTLLRGRVLWFQGRRSDWRKLLSSEIRLAKSGGDARRQMALLAGAAEFENREERARPQSFRKALALCDGALRLARATPDPVLEAIALNAAGRAHGDMGDAPAAMRAFNDGLARLVQAGIVHEAGFALFMNIGRLAMQGGHLDQARDVFQAALATARKLGDPDLALEARNALEGLPDGGPIMAGPGQ